MQSRCLVPAHPASSRKAARRRVVRAVHSVLAGHRYMSAQVAERMVQTIDISPDAQLHARLTARPCSKDWHAATVYRKLLAVWASTQRPSVHIKHVYLKNLKSAPKPH